MEATGTMIYHIHFTFAVIFGAYAILTLVLNNMATRHDPASEAYRTLNKRLYWVVMIGNFVLLASFLTGGYLGTPYFKMKSPWIFGKLIGFVILGAVMGMMGMRNIKKRQKALEANDAGAVGMFTEKIGAFAYLQLILGLGMIAFAFSRRFFPQLVNPGF